MQVTINLPSLDVDREIAGRIHAAIMAIVEPGAERHCIGMRYVDGGIDTDHWRTGVYMEFRAADTADTAL